MSNITDSTYESFVNDFIQARNSLGQSTLNLANLFLKVQVTLGNNRFLEWLKDSRVNIKRMQVQKFIEVAKTCQNASRLASLVNSAGIEKSYHLTNIKDQSIIDQAAQVIDASFTVKQVKDVVNYVNDNVSLEAAVVQVKSSPKENSEKKASLPTKKDLFHKYETLQQSCVEYKRRAEHLEEQNKKLRSELKKMLGLKNDKEVDKILNDIPQGQMPLIPETPKECILLDNGRLAKPVETEKTSEFYDENRHSIVCKGIEYPMPPDFEYTDQSTQELQEIAVRYANATFNEEE